MCTMLNLEPQSTRQHPEILSPVGSEEMLMAAIHNGADAVYLGMPGYNARARSEDFSFETLARFIAQAHLYGVKVLVAFNILIFEEELDTLLPDLKALLELQPDAIIVQDIGLVQLIRAMSPQQVIHASTQMTVTHQRAIHLLEDLNLKRFVLGREVSMAEMKQIRQATTRELEVFVHGALCVAYSGQCLTSESFGGRSANRGQCAQSCRMPYGLVVDGKLMDLGDKKHLVSPLDLCGLDEVPELVRVGIDSFKIEGRYKSPEYVASVTSAYHRAVVGQEVALAHRQAMEVSFSRGFFRGWLQGVDHNHLVSGEHSSHRGLEIGRVLKTQISKGIPSMEIETTFTLQKGDSLLFCNQNGRALTGGKIYELSQISATLQSIAMARDFALQDIKGQGEVRCFINRSAQMDREWQKTWKDKALLKKIELTLSIQAKVGEFLQLRGRDAEGHEAVVFSEQVLEQANQKALDEIFLKETLGAWGASCFSVTAWEMHLDGAGFLPQGALKKLRQELQKNLEALRQKSQAQSLVSIGEVRTWMTPKIQSPDSAARLLAKNQNSNLAVLVREPEQLAGLEGLDVQEVILDFKHGVTYGPSLQKIRELGFKGAIATTRIVKPGEERRLHDILKHQPDRILVRNLAALHFFKEHSDFWQVPWTGDFSFNISNHLSAEYFLMKGLDRISPSYDLNMGQLQNFLGTVDPHRVEITVHQYMPSFHMEHCVFATFLSTGSSIADCGMVCRQHKVELKDEKGILHPLQADQECRNTMFNGVPQSIASLIPTLKKCGVQFFRLEALTENASELRKKVAGTIKVLKGEWSGEQLKQELGCIERFGVTEGQLLNSRRYEDRKKS
jgi:U32 family peptidase